MQTVLQRTCSGYNKAEQRIIKNAKATRDVLLTVNNSLKEMKRGLLDYLLANVCPHFRSKAVKK